MRILVWTWTLAIMLTFTLMPGASADDAPSAQLPEPTVVMEADPPPPFTYWVPEGATIRNHPRHLMTWIAESAEGSRKYYFGDQCRASEFQRFVGQPLDALPEKPAGATWRMACSTCAVTSDLGRDRMNVVYDEETRAITEISCG